MKVPTPKLSSRGQVVIPAVTIKKASALDAKLKDDLEFARRTEEALKRYERGEFITMEFDEFIEEMKKW